MGPKAVDLLDLWKATPAPYILEQNFACAIKHTMHSPPVRYNLRMCLAIGNKQ